MYFLSWGPNFFFYVDDGVFLCPDKTKVDNAIKELQQDLELEDQGDIADYLGINFTYQKDGKIVMSQPQLIDKLISDLKLGPNAHLPPTPAVSSRILNREENAPAFKNVVSLPIGSRKIKLLRKGYKTGHHLCNALMHMFL